MTGYGDFVDVDDEGLTKGYNYPTGGVTMGADYRVTDHFVIGLMGGYAHTWIDLKSTGSVDVDTGWGGLHAVYFNQGLYVLGAAFGGVNSVDTSRTALVGPPANGSSDSQEFTTFLSADYDFHFGHTRYSCDRVRPEFGARQCGDDAGVAVQWTPCISTYVSYDGQLGRDRYDSTVSRADSGSVSEKLAVAAGRKFLGDYQQLLLII